MRRLHAAVHGLRSLLRKGPADQELDAEIRFHLDMQVEENLRRGMSPEEARRAAHLTFGGVEGVKESCRESRGAHALDVLLQDLRQAVRHLRKNPGFTLVVAATLALGIGATTAIWSAVYAVLFKPLPYAQGQELVVLRQVAPAAGIDDVGFSVSEVEDYRQRTPSLAGLVEYHSMTFHLLGRGEPLRVSTGVVSSEFFDVLGVRPLHGRTFLPGDDDPGAHPVLILSHAFWQTALGGDPAIVGQDFEMNDKVHTVVGVLPPVPQYPEENDVYMPTSACPFRSAEQFIANREARMMSVFARLKPGVTFERAQADLSAVAAQLEREYPQFYPPRFEYGLVATSLHEALTREARTGLLVLLGATGFVLLIVCANVANLALARLVKRDRELAVRTALGAGRRRLARQLLTESTLLSLLGGALGLAVAWAARGLIVAFAERQTPRAGEIEIDGTVLLFALTVSVVTGLAFGALPALARRHDLVGSLKDGSRTTSGTGSRRARGLLIVAQLAVSFVLLAGAGLTLKSLMALSQVDPGFDTENVLAVRLDLSMFEYTEESQRIGFAHSLLERVGTLPGVRSTGLSLALPVSETMTSSFIIEDRPVEPGTPRPRAGFRVASADYFRTVGIGLVRGRLFTAADDVDAPMVAVINQTMARQHWGEEDPVGRRVSLDVGETWSTVVGVVGDVKADGLDEESGPEIYLPYDQQATTSMRLFVRTAADPMATLGLVREIVHRLEPEAPVSDPQTLEELRRELLASPRLTATLLGLFAGLALAIAAIGVAALIAFSVSQRRHEIGVRMALGASRGTVLRMVVSQGMTPVFVGLALGIAGALALTRLLAGLLFGVEPTDPATFLAMSLVLLAATAFACWLPARRATAIDPMIALRNE